MKKTVKQRKDELASKRGYKDWDHLVHKSSLDEYWECRNRINNIITESEYNTENQKSFMAYAIYALVFFFQYILAVSLCVALRIIANTFLSPFADFEMAIGWAGGTFFVLIMAFRSAKWTNWICKFLKIK